MYTERRIKWPSQEIASRGRTPDVTTLDDTIYYYEIYVCLNNRETSLYTLHLKAKIIILLYYNYIQICTILLLYIMYEQKFKNCYNKKIYIKIIS